MAEFHVDSILALVEQNPQVSDLHLAEGEVLSLRINGEVVKQQNAGVISREAAEMFLRQLFQGDPQRFDAFLADKDRDFAFVSKSGMSYRVNAFRRTGKLGVVMRKINREPAKIQDLMISEIAESIKNHVLAQKKGLYLVTGPTGSGKSTSLVSMLEWINETREENLITIEDPIEYIFEPKKCLVSQREIGHDTRSYANALRAAMRQDPDVIFVGEIRDRETAEAVLSLAESGHLVFSTMHTNSASRTINRFIGFFPPEIQAGVSERLAESLIGVQSQFLVKTADASTRVGLFEVMLNTTSVKNNIKKREIAQLDNIIDSSSMIGMMSLARYTQKLIDSGIVDRASVGRVFE